MSNCICCMICPMCCNVVENERRTPLGVLFIILFGPLMLFSMTYQGLTRLIKESECLQFLVLCFASLASLCYYCCFFFFWIVFYVILVIIWLFMTGCNLHQSLLEPVMLSLYIENLTEDEDVEFP